MIVKHRGNWRITIPIFFMIYVCMGAPARNVLTLEQDSRKFRFILVVVFARRPLDLRQNRFYFTKLCGQLVNVGKTITLRTFPGMSPTDRRVCVGKRKKIKTSPE